MKSVSFATLTAVLLVAARVEAHEPEPIRLEVRGAEGCLSEGALHDDVKALGGRFRDALEAENARTFSVEVTREADVQAKLVVRDLVGATTTRTVSARSCHEAASSLALFVAMALDEERGSSTTATTAAPSDMSLEDRSVWPAPAAEPPARRPAKARGSGGLAADGYYGFEGTYGVHAFAAVLAGRTRFGAAAALQQGELASQAWLRSTPESSFGAARPRYVGSRTLGRTGLLIGWGAPWNDSVAGFVAEAGVALGEDRFDDQARDPATQRPRGGRHERFVTPYVSWALVLQVPWRWRLRPFASLAGTWLPLDERAPNPLLEGTSVHTGVAWQAW